MIKIPGIAITAEMMNDTKKKVLELGMNDYISKPVNHEVLYEKVLYHVERSSTKGYTSKTV